MKSQFSHHAHEAALHFVARPEQYALTDAQRYDLAQVVRGYTGKCDEEAAQRGLDWMRRYYRKLGQEPRF